jgi:ribose-phosphate pyrophosphokinase
MNNLKVCATPGFPELAEKICKELEKLIYPSMEGKSFSLAKLEWEEFSNHNHLLKLGENMRGSFVVVLHTQVPPNVDGGIVSLFHIIDALNNSGAEEVLLVFPYLPYSRSDKKNQPRISSLAPFLLKTLNNSPSSIKKFLLLDPHDTHLKHYVNPAAQEVTASYIFVKYIKDHMKENGYKKEDCRIVFPDAGAAKRFEKIPELIDLQTVYFDKIRVNHKEDTEINGISGNVKGKKCILFDDEICSGGTIIESADFLKEEGASFVELFVSHPIFEKKGLSVEELMTKINNSSIDKIVATDSVPIKEKAKLCPKLEILSVSKLLAIAIRNIYKKHSVSCLLEPENADAYYLKK